VVNAAGTVFRNGSQISSGYSEQSRIAATANDWYLYSDGKVFKNGQEVTGGGAFVGQGDIAASNNGDWYIVSMTGKVYKGINQIAEGYTVYCSIAVR
jgi:hypothetical protein